MEQFPEREEDQEYEVERILASRENADGETFYLVKWMSVSQLVQSIASYCRLLYRGMFLLQLYPDRSNVCKYVSESTSEVIGKCHRLTIYLISIYYW